MARHRAEACGLSAFRWCQLQQRKLGAGDETGYDVGRDDSNLGTFVASETSAQNPMVAVDARFQFEMRRCDLTRRS
jgi:hypothetical protein